MIFNNLDSICKRWLLEKGLPLHYYLEALLHSSSCLRQLNISTLKVVRTVKLPVNSYFAVDLPNDFMDDVALSIPIGQFLQPIAKKNSITSIRNTDSTGAFVPYTDSDVQNSTVGGGFTGGWFWNVDDYGGSTGRLFGGNGAMTGNGYKVDKARRQIQLTETFSSDEIVLQYISNGQSADNATEVDAMAEDAIKAFISWKSSPNADIKDSYEARTYYNEARVLVGRLDDLTVTDIKSIFRKSYTASVKS